MDQQTSTDMEIDRRKAIIDEIMLLITENAALKTEVAKLQHQLAASTTQPLVLSETASTFVQLSAPAISVPVLPSSSPLPLPSPSPSPSPGPPQLSLPSQSSSQKNKPKRWRRTGHKRYWRRHEQDRKHDYKRDVI